VEVIAGINVNVRCLNVSIALKKKMRETLNHLEYHTRHINCIRLHKSTNKKHRNKMVEICNWLIDNGYHFVTEAKFKKGGRADIVVLETGDAYEIMNTEEMERFNKKKYPIPTYPIKVTDKWRGL